MDGKSPPEVFPAIGTVENPAIFYDGSDVLLCYEIAPVDEGGHAILAFSDVIYLEKNPNNVPEGIRASAYPTRAWDFTEVTGSDRNDRWGRLGKRFWTISFNDVTVEIVFAHVGMVHEDREPLPPPAALRRFLAERHEAGDRS